MVRIFPKEVAASQMSVPSRSFHGKIVTKAYPNKTGKQPIPVNRPSKLKADTDKDGK